MNHAGSRVMMGSDTEEPHGVSSSRVKALMHRTHSNGKAERLEATNDSLTRRSAVLPKKEEEQKN